MKTGRPTAYKPEYCEDIVKYFEQEAAAIHLPHLSRWARERAGVCHDTAIEWTKVHEDFSAAYKKAKDIQKEVLIDGALAGKFQQTFAIFTAKNITDMRDVQETKNESNVHVTGLEKLSDEQLDGVIKKFQNPASQGALREGQENSTEPAQVRQAAP